MHIQRHQSALGPADGWMYVGVRILMQYVCVHKQHVRMHTCRHQSALGPVGACTYVYVCVRMCTYVYVCVRIYIHVRMHT